jgi:hypothetical protein
MLIDQITEKALLLNESEQQITLDFMDSILFEVEDIEEYNRDIDKAIADYEKNGGISHVEVIEMSKEWVK